MGDNIMTIDVNLGIFKKSVSRAVALACAGLILSGGVAVAHPAKSLDAVIAGDHRSAENKARDQYRHPKETLDFFGLKADMTEVYILPGNGGWFQSILTRYLHANVTYY